MSSGSYRTRLNQKYFDYTLLFAVIFLIGFGLVMLYSVSSYEALSKFGDSAFYLKKQIRAVAIGLILMLVISQIPYTFWKKISGVAYWLAILLCLWVIVAGTDANGSQRWINIGGFSLQPSEIAKLAVIIYLAAVLSRMPKQIRYFKNVLLVLLRLVPILAMIAYSNLSTAIIIAGIAILMMFVVSPVYSHYIGLVALGAVGMGAFVLLAQYRSTRIMAWLHPEEYTDTVFQTVQGLYAIGSGGLFGKGLGGSIQKMGYVPEAQNDFIFTIIVEELGLFGAVCLLALFVLLIWRFMVIANNAKDLLGSMLVIGILCHVALQVILNIMVVTNMMPNTGITLPFISYGGTSIMMLMSEIGIVLNVSKSIPLRLGQPGRELEAWQGRS